MNILVTLDTKKCVSAWTTWTLMMETASLSKMLVTDQRGVITEDLNFQDPFC